MSIQLLGIFNYYLFLEIKPRRQIKQRERSLQNPVSGVAASGLLFSNTLWRDMWGVFEANGPATDVCTPTITCEYGWSSDHCLLNWNNSECACLLMIAYWYKATEVNTYFYFLGRKYTWKEQGAYFSTHTNWFLGQQHGRWEGWRNAVVLTLSLWGKQNFEAI